MRTLPNVQPTPEQLSIISRNQPSVEVIRGAAGSGKTTTALLKLRTLTGVYLSRKRRLHTEAPVRILVLTFNRTLRGYIEALAEGQASDDVDLTISTFGSWAWGTQRRPSVLCQKLRHSKIRELGRELQLDTDYLVEEVEYVLGRFHTESLSDYLTARRLGRGTSPRVDRKVREDLLTKVIDPYLQWKESEGRLDWDDVALQMMEVDVDPYDVVIVDEAQDFSANQIRAIMPHLADPHSLIFVMDTVQRIYPRGHNWTEAGVKLLPANSHRLKVNYRNTREIALLAASMIAGLPLDQDGSMPDFTKCERHGALPNLLAGTFREQVAWAIERIKEGVDLSSESVAFLHPLGGGWFSYLRGELEDQDIDFAEITRQEDWPSGDENVALSTLASAKGLEFDHVFVLGLNSEALPQGEEDGEEDGDDDRLAWARRLVAMGIGRAKHTVTLGYKPGEESKLVGLLDVATYELVKL